MQNENRLVPDFREETVQTYTETYTPEGGTEQTATYKIGSAHPIIGGILDKLAWARTHVAAVWWNKLAGVTLKDKIDTMDESIAQLNGNTYKQTATLSKTSHSAGGSISVNSIKRVGSVCNIDFQMSGVNIAGNTPIATVPEQFIPGTTRFLIGVADYQGTVQAITFAVNSAGNLVNGWGAGTVTSLYIAGTYII